MVIAKNKKNNFASNLILVSSSLVTILVNPLTGFDAVNVPKLMVLIPVGISLGIFIFANLKKIKITRITILATIFIIFTGLSAILSESPSTQVFYGKEGRYNGFLTLTAIVFFLVFVIYFIEFETMSKKLLSYQFWIGIIFILYGYIQLLNIDPFKWATVNVKIFSTFGNPNFLSAAIAAFTFPIIHKIMILNIDKKIKMFFILFFNLLALFLILKTFSIQGAVAYFSGYFILIYFAMRKKVNLLLKITFGLVFGIISFFTLIGTLGHGIFKFLHKSSVISRGDFFRSSFNMIRENFLFGVGPDSFGDYFLRYRDNVAAIRPNAEFADSSHNYFLDIFTNLGVIPFLIYVIFTVYVLICFLKLINKSENSYFIYLFCFWISLQIQSLVSPTNFVFLLWISISSAVAISASNQIQRIFVRETSVNYLLGISILATSLLVWPIVIKDLNIKNANDAKSVEKLMKANESFPKGTASYYRAIRLFDDNGLKQQAYIEAKKVVVYNNRAHAGYYILAVSPFSSNQEKADALKRLFELDPKNPVLVELRALIR